METPRRAFCSDKGSHTLLGCSLGLASAFCCSRGIIAHWIELGRGRDWSLLAPWYPPCLSLGYPVISLCTRESPVLTRAIGPGPFWVLYESCPEAVLPFRCLSSHSQRLLGEGQGHYTAHLLLAFCPVDRTLWLQNFPYLTGML